MNIGRIRLIFEQLLKGIFEQKILDSDLESARVKYLRELKPDAEKLYAAFQTQQVSVDFRCFQIPYLLRYFPFYTELLPRVLEDLRTRNVQLQVEEGFCPVFFGCGPAPEFVGLLSHMHRHFPHLQKITPQFLDLEPESWWLARDIVRDYVLPSQLQNIKWDNSPPVIAGKIEATNMLDKLGARIDFSKCHLAVFQNFFNEISDELKKYAIENIMQIGHNMPPGGLIVMIHRAKYPTVTAMLKDIQSAAEHTRELRPVGNVALKEKAFACQPQDAVPKIIRENLYPTFADGFVDKLTYANSINYIYLALQRTR